MEFQSTPLIRGATTGAKLPLGCAIFQSTPLIRGATAVQGLHGRTWRFQSTPLIRGATRFQQVYDAIAPFQSTPLIRGATRFGACRPTPQSHFNPRPSYEGRPHSMTRARGKQYFNPRPSYEGRLSMLAAYLPVPLFQSTPLIRGATRASKARRNRRMISIHAPHTRGDRVRYWLSNLHGISIHAPHTRGDGTSGL